MNSVMNPVTSYPGLSPAQASLGTSFTMSAAAAGGLGGSLGAMGRAGYGTNMVVGAGVQSRPSFAIQELLGLSAHAHGTSGVNLNNFPGMASATVQHSHQSNPFTTAAGHHHQLFPQDHHGTSGNHNTSYPGYVNLEIC